MKEEHMMMEGSRMKKVTTVSRKVTKTIQQAHIRIRCMVQDQRGEAYVDMAVKILIGVVIGALLLSGLYSLFGDSVLPKLTQKINGMFDYTAAGP